MLDLSIVIVSWNVSDLLNKCLASIYKNQGELNLEILVIDNASTDNTVEMVKTFYPEVNLITNKDNYGFAKANNQGMAKGKGRYILVLNPDTEILPDTLEKMLEFMNKNYKIGIVGCKHLNPDFTLQPSVRRLPTLLPILLIFTKITKVLPGLPVLNRYLAKNFDYKITQPAEQVAGSFLMIRREVIDEIGGFDENFFIWFEEVDFCKRAKEAGWKIWYNAEGQIIHYGGRSFRQELTFKKQVIFFKSAWYYFKKHGFKWV